MPCLLALALSIRYTGRLAVPRSSSEPVSKADAAPFCGVSTSGVVFETAKTPDYSTHLVQRRFSPSSTTPGTWPTARPLGFVLMRKSPISMEQYSVRLDARERIRFLWALSGETGWKCWCQQPVLSTIPTQTSIPSPFVRALAKGQTISPPLFRYILSCYFCPRARLMAGFNVSWDEASQSQHSQRSSKPMLVPFLMLAN